MARPCEDINNEGLITSIVQAIKQPKRHMIISRPATHRWEMSSGLGAASIAFNF